MRDKTHVEFIERWSDFVKTNPEWKKHHTDFINAQYDKFITFINLFNYLLSLMLYINTFN